MINMGIIASLVMNAETDAMRVTFALMGAAAIVRMQETGAQKFKMD